MARSFAAKALGSLVAGTAGPALLACGAFAGTEDVVAAPVPDAGSDAPTSSLVDVVASPPPTEAGGPEGGAGDRLVVFVTTNAVSPPASASAADNLCADDALGRLPGRFVAWYPSGSTAPPDRLVTSQGTAADGPWFLVNGARVVANRAALSNAGTKPLESAIEVAPGGQPRNGGVWTGTRADGSVGRVCGSSTTPTIGLSALKDGDWTETDSFAPSCADTLRLYCFQVE